MSGDVTAPHTAGVGNKGSKEFYCLNCHSPGYHGMSFCSECGTKYVWEDVPDCEAEGGEDSEAASGSDFEPLFDQKDVECGFFDVEGGTFVFTDKTCFNRYELSECQNCGTLLELPVKSCPLCGGSPEKIVGGLGALFSGAVAGAGIDAEASAQLFCQSCGEMVAYAGGRCCLCGARLVPQSESLSNPAIRMIPSENIPFVHLNVGSGIMEYLSESGRSESESIAGGGSADTAQVTDIGVFDRISMMFDEQTSTIIGLTSNNPMTASEICRRLRMPRSVCYRKLKMLTDARLLNLFKEEGSPGGWQVSRYLSNIDMAYVALEHGDMNMLLRLKDSKETQRQRFSSELR